MILPILDLQTQTLLSAFVIPIIVEAVADNVEFGGNDATYDAAQTYVGSGHLTGEEDESVEVYNHARDICREVCVILR